MVVEFMKPVFGFEASMVKVTGGTITRQVHTVTLGTTDIIILIIIFILSA